MSFQHIHELLRYSHITLGTIGLVLFWVPALVRKGSRVHVVSGRWFNRTAYAVAATAGVSCVWAIASPLGFTGITRQLSTEEQSSLVANIRFLFIILLTLMTWLVSGLAIGSHVIRNKSDFRVHSAFPRRCSRAVAVVSLGCGLFGVSLLYNANLNGVLPIFLAWVGYSDARQNLRLLSMPSPSPDSWKRKHIECMMGSGVAMHTAFFVFGANRLIGLQLDGLLQLVPWIMPTLIGVLATNLLVKKHCRSPAPLDAHTV